MLFRSSLLCDLEWDGERVARVVPRRAMAHNDCSIRREGAKKISQKKNWGAATKGTADTGIEIDRFAEGGVLDGYRLACFLLRDGELVEQEAGQPIAVEDAALDGYRLACFLLHELDSPVSGYSYMYERLLDWLVSKLNDQVDEGPLENISEWLATAGRPAQALISIGATRYTDYGETTFLARGDVSIVALYDAARFDLDAIRAIARGDTDVPAEGLSLLRQTVV